MQQDNAQYPHIGQFHWKYFQLQNGKRNVAVSSTVPRVDMMLDSGMVKEFTDKKRGANYSVLFDREYVFDYLYQKIVVNMGWVNNSKLDANVLKCFLGDFLTYCEALHKEGEMSSVKAQAIVLAQQFPHRTVEQWERELIGDIKEAWMGSFDETDNEKVLLEQQDTQANSTTVKSVSDETEEEMITMDDYDPDIEEDCDGDSDIPSDEFWEQANKENRGE